jgi:hypothetical protein
LFTLPDQQAPITHHNGTLHRNKTPANNLASVPMRSE